MKTKIILEKDVHNLGVTGDSADVARGYARNYLFPRGYAVPATARTVAKWAAQKEKLAEQNKAKLALAQEEAKKVGEVTVSLQVRAGEDGKLFGSVTTAEVASQLSAKGFAVDKRAVEFREAIKTTGEFTALVRLHPQVRATFKIKVEPIAQ